MSDVKRFVLDEVIHGGKRYVRGDEIKLDSDVAEVLEDEGRVGSKKPSTEPLPPSGELADVADHVLVAELESRGFKVSGAGGGSDDDFDPASVPADADEKTLDGLTVDQLKAVAADREVEVDAKAKKADLVKALTPKS